MPSRFYLGIDGGQSGTKALIADENGSVIGSGSGGPCNHVPAAQARDKFLSGVGRALDEACAGAGLDCKTVKFAAACLGLSGGPQGKESYAQELIRSAKFKFTHDAEIALSGATAGEPGIIVIAGTGSIAFGRNAAGRTARAGGWGYIFGDEGGAFDLTRRALRAALKYEEGWGPETSLRKRLLEVTAVATANELLHRFYTPEYPRSVVASYAPLVSAAADEGDEVARRVMAEAATELVMVVAGVYRQLFVVDELVLVAPVGGAFSSGPLLNEFEARVKTAISCQAHRPRFNPAAGAVIEALRLDQNARSLSGAPDCFK